MARPKRGQIAVKALEAMERKIVSPVISRAKGLVEYRLSIPPDEDVPVKEWRRKWQR